MELRSAAPDPCRAHGRTFARLAAALVLTACLQASAAAQGATHVVEPGDTPTQLARRYDTTVTALREANGLASDLLRIGAVLRLPAGAGWHVLQVPESDSWPSLAQRTGIPASTLRAANPGVEDPAGGEVLVPPADGVLAWPREGEDLILLAARLGVPPGRLAAVNGLAAPYRLTPERPVVLPEPPPGAEAGVPAAPAPAPLGEGRGGAAPSGAERRASHVALRDEAFADLAELVRGRILSPPDEGFAWPLEGRPRLTSLFGWRSISVAGNRYHQGIDLGAASGTRVHAARDGVVVRAAWVGAYGYAVYLAHDGGFETRYGHLSRISVRVGERIAKGSELGAVGSTGASTGPHLHFEARLDGRALDPLEVLPEYGGRSAAR